MKRWIGGALGAVCGFVAYQVLWSILDIDVSWASLWSEPANFGNVSLTIVYLLSILIPTICGFVICKFEEGFRVGSFILSLLKTIGVAVAVVIVLFLIWFFICMFFYVTIKPLEGILSLLLFGGVTCVVAVAVAMFAVIFFG